METDETNYNFRTIEQSAAYKLTPTEVIVTCRKGLNRSVQAFPLRIIRTRQSTWEMTSQSWIALVVVAALTIVFGIWGLIDPKATGMYTVVALSLIAVGIITPYCFWNHRRLTGVTFSGDSDFSLAVIAHAVPTREFYEFVNSLESRIQNELNEH